jgi:predicted nucleotidyltransferase component of viral defense system
MKAHLIDLAQQRADPIARQNTAREYLQARILTALQRAGAMIPLAFHGGTALRVLYGIPRYSEDLDFTLEQAANLYDFRQYLRSIKSALQAEGYQVGVKMNDRKVVHSAFIRFEGLLFELGLSPHPNQIFAIKLEVDSNPPAGAALETTVIRRHATLQLQHHNPASLLAGKLHAVLQRPYTKGRDIFDLFWYLSAPQWSTPNFTLLNNALQQTGWQGETLDVQNWRQLLRLRLESLNWQSVSKDVTPFLEAGFNSDVFTQENLLRLLSK